MVSCVMVSSSCVTLYFCLAIGITVSGNMANLPKKVDFNINKRIRLQGMVTTSPGTLDNIHVNVAALFVDSVPSYIVINGASKSS